MNLLAIAPSWSFGEILRALIIIAACIAIVYIALRKFDVTIPEWAVSMFWIVVVAFVAIFALNLLLSM